MIAVSWAELTIDTLLEKDLFVNWVWPVLDCLVDLGGRMGSWLWVPCLLVVRRVSHCVRRSNFFFLPDLHKSMQVMVGMSHDML